MLELPGRDESNKQERKRNKGMEPELAAAERQPRHRAARRENQFTQSCTIPGGSNSRSSVGCRAFAPSLSPVARQTFSADVKTSDSKRGIQRGIQPSTVHRLVFFSCPLLRNIRIVSALTSTSAMITLQTVPVDLLLNVGTYLTKTQWSARNNIDEITLAATLKDYEMMEYYVNKYNDYYAPHRISVSVAMSGNLKALKWVVKKGFPMNENTCHAAASSGNLKMLKWLRNKGCPMNEYTCNGAAGSGNLKILQWLHSKGYPWNEHTCTAAAREGHLETLQWLHGQGCPLDAEIWYGAMSHPTILKWLQSQNCPNDKYSSFWAASYGHLEVLQWLHSVGCPWDEDTCYVAADSGHLEVLQFLHSAGCPWNERACQFAAWRGHLEVLQWLHSAGCPWNEHSVQSAAAESGNVELQQWVKDNLVARGKKRKTAAK
jgi:hypothetical protein